MLFAPQEPILLWPFEVAPEKYRRLSENGDDEEWLMVVPRDSWLPTDWMYLSERVDHYDLPDGVTVVVGSHG